MTNKIKYYVFSEGYMSYNHYEGKSRYFGKVSIDSSIDGDLIDYDSEYITDKWGGNAIAGIQDDENWGDPEFSNGLIHIYEGEDAEEANKQYLSYIQGEEVEFKDIETW